jgi:multimeric flavodoxin WrbA
MKVLGVSGSPIANSNTDRAVRRVLEHTGVEETEFVKLVDYQLAPCQACLGCLKTNTCILHDDGNALCAKAREADALVIGGFTPYSSLDARTKIFIERLYPNRHRHGFMRGKPGAAIVTTALPRQVEGLPPAGETGINSIMFYMMEEGMNFLGGIRVEGNVPCIKCGQSENCEISGLPMIYGSGATVENVGVHALENQPDVLEAAANLGRRIGEALRAGATHASGNGASA